MLHHRRRRRRAAPAMQATLDVGQKSCIGRGGGRPFRAGQDQLSPRPTRLGQIRLFSVAAVVLMLYLDARPAVADDGASPAAERPAILADRWREDWSRLADPRLRTQPFDELKFIPLGAHAPDSYLSLGLTLRESFERSDAPAFGTSEDQPSDTYGLQRLQFHVDLRLNKNLQIFTQFEDVRTFDKKTISSTEANRLDLRLAFPGLHGAAGRRNVQGENRPAGFRVRP
ncbi:alginate export family protein [Chenggangzhangella methanolivorans]|uniref:alginate export family protein n=1 Tax=Chenggangzhangella methanolivorans TaxID=1437009 RepID=UPI0021BDE594|nr:alginate export family protein [Chenggangzhangella methanolivorans]